MTDATGKMTVVCLDCGRHLPYDWKQMRVLKAAERSGDSRDPDHRTAKKKFALIGSLVSIGLFLGQRWIRKRTAGADEKPMRPSS